MNTPASQSLLELVDQAGRAVGVSEKLAAHQSPGRLHRAFSVLLLDDHGRLLLQQRAAGKYHFPLAWTNSCCGHPAPDEPPVTAAARRVWQELRVTPALLREVATVNYTVMDDQTGLVEREFDHIFLGEIRDEAHPDPDEVAATMFVGPAELSGRLLTSRFTLWFEPVLRAARPALREWFGAQSGW